MTLRPVDPKRNYGVDALRILSMLMIAVHHIITHGGVLKTRDLFSLGYDSLVFAELTVLCAVNCYVLISGYVGAFSKTRYSNLAALWLQVFFYSFGITLLFKLFAPDVVTLRILFRSLIPVTSREYWFFSCYFVLFLLTPILNLAIQQLSRRRLEVLLLSLFVILGVVNVVYSVYYNTDTLSIFRGYSAWWMAVLYLTGGYIRKYNPLAHIKKSRFLIVFFGTVAVSTALKLLVQSYSYNKYHSLKYNMLFYQYNSLNICICAIALLLFFIRLDLKNSLSRIVAFLTPMTFGVYLIHDHPLIRNYFMKRKLGFLHNLPAPLMILAILGLAVAIYLSCSGVDWLRLQLFKLLKIKLRLETLENRIRQSFSSEKKKPD